MNQRNLSSEIMLSTKTSPALLSGQLQFDCLLENRWGIMSSAPVFSGIFNQGRQTPSMGCVDGDYFENVSIQSIKLSLTDTGLDVPLFKILGELVPGGGSFQVSYLPNSDESRTHNQTKQALQRRYPPVVTSLGYLLFLADCGIGIKDRHSAEDGGGFGKLQGFKAFNSEESKRKGLSLVRELHQFLGTKFESDELARACRTRAFAAIEKIHAISG